MAAGALRRVCDGSRPGDRRARRPPVKGGSTRYDPWSVPVLDLVFLATVVALFALVSALAAGVEKL